MAVPKNLLSRKIIKKKVRDKKVYFISPSKTGNKNFFYRGRYIGKTIKYIVKINKKQYENA